MDASSGLFFGTVVSSDAVTYTIQIAPEDAANAALLSGIPLSTVMAYYMGVREAVLPQPGSKAFCFKLDSSSCLVLGVIPNMSAIADDAELPLRVSLKTGDAKQKINNILGITSDKQVMSKQNMLNAGRPTDVVDGEYVLSNEFGVLLGLFNQFATLKASELAQIQCFLLDDLVRVVAHNYEQITGLGTTKIFQDAGTLSAEINLTDNAEEGVGRPNVSTSHPPNIQYTGQATGDDTEDFYELNNEKRVPIDRFKGFVGALGDFIHLILTRPDPDQLRAHDGEKVDKPDRGLLSVKLGANGMVALRSLEGIALEKTNWVRVPQRIATPEDPSIEDNPTKNKLPSFKFDKSVVASDIPFLYFLQLRDYLAYTFEERDYEAFTSSEKFEINNDPQKEAPLDGELPLDPERSHEYIPKNSGIYFMPNGGVMLKDAWGSALVMEGGNIYLQPAKDLVAQPLRDLVGKVGRFTSIASKQDIDLSSTSGGLRVKTDLSQFLYSDKSGIILSSNATAAHKVEGSEDRPADFVGGVLLHAPNAGIATHSQHSVLSTKGSSVTRSGQQFFDVKDQFLLKSRGPVSLYSESTLLFFSEQALINYSSGTAVFLGETSTALGAEDQTIAVSPMGAVTGLFDEDLLQTWRQRLEELGGVDPSEAGFAYRTDDEFLDFQFKFLPSTAYGLQDQVDVLPQTLRQQQDRLHGGELVDWLEAAVNETLPYPGADRAETLAVVDIQNLVFDDELGDLYNKATGSATEATVEFENIFKNYKVHG